MEYFTTKPLNEQNKYHKGVFTNATQKTEVVGLKGVKYHCNSCRRDITVETRIRCVICPDFDLCLHCFSNGVEIIPHKRDHEYRVCTNMHFPLFVEDWGADEELLLLEAISLYGFGSWDEISDHIGTKTPLECKNHYLNVYIESPTTPLPSITVKPGTKMKESQCLIKNTPTTKNKKTPKHQSAPSQPEHGGYMPKRKEFETEFDNEAETKVANIEFTEVDTEDEIQLKLKMLHFYNLSLDERYRVRNVIVDNDLVEWRKNESNIKKKPKFQREMISKMRPFLQVVGKEKHDSIIEGFLEEHRLRKKIELLQESKKSSKFEPSSGDKHKLEESIGSNLSVESPIQKKQRKSSMIDILNCPYSQLLSSNEKDHCAKLKLSPSQYLLVKQAFLFHCLKNETITIDEAHQLCKLDRSIVDKLFDFFESSGWINKKYVNTSNQQGLSVKNALLSLSRPAQNRVVTTLTSPFNPGPFNK
eukprot:TRINITY_DN2759_c0_g1_i2.p1 TRINITY_DN2759_c0_g1~~TRINITY_DN2759_c0_g1_i2.p1  ORF type:complete len:474 (+),score=121.78 TRINITY_DN2759_c0_g1_i2:65-1486(+)